MGKLRDRGKLPRNLIIKSSAILAPSDPASCSLLERLGADTINVSTDFSTAQIGAIREATQAPLDIYAESPDGIGGFVRHFETPELIEHCSSIYIKLGLRNSADIYPCGRHMKSLALRLSLERVRRSKLVYDLIQREYPDAQMSKAGLKFEDLGVPEI